MISPPFHLRTLGRLALVDAAGVEEPTLGTRRRKLAVLAVLALSRRPVSRDVLVGMFWPEQPEERARHSLSDTLSHLRRVLGAEALVTTRADVALAPAAPLTVDVLALLTAASARDWDGVLTRWQGGFVADLAVPGSNAFDHWADGVRASVEQAGVRAAAAVCDALAAGDADAQDRRLAVAERWLEAAPLSADAARHLLEAVSHAGTAEAAQRALDAYQRLARRLLQELEAAPDVALQPLVQTLRDRVAGGPAPSQPVTPDVAPTHDAPTHLAPTHLAPTHLAPTHDASARPARVWVRWAAVAAVLLAGVVTWPVLRDRRAAGVTREDAPTVFANADGPALLLVADFETGGLDPAVALVVAEAARQEVAAQPRLDVVDAIAVQRAVRALDVATGVPLDSALALRVARATRATGVVTGGVRVSAAGMVLDATLVTPAGEALGTATAVARDSSELIPSAVSLVQRLLSPARGETRRNMEAATVGSADLDALARYAEAVRVLERGGDRDRAVALLEEAVARDSTFAVAARRLALIYYREEATRDRMVLHLARAWRHAARQPEAERELTVGTYHMLVTGDHAAAAAAFRARLALRPRDRATWHNLGMMYQYVGDERRAADAYTRALAVDSTVSTTWLNLIDAHAARGDTTQAWRTVERMARVLPGHAGLYLRSGMLAASLGQMARADSLYRSLARATPDDPREQSTVLTLRAALAWAAGDSTGGDALRERAIGHDRARRAASAVLRGTLDLAASAWWLRGDTALARRRLARALAETPVTSLPPLDRPWLEVATLQALTGDPDAARASLAAWERDVPLSLRRFDVGAAESVRGAIALAERRYDEAIRAYREASGPLCPVCGVAELSTAFDAASRPDSARATAARYLTTPTVRHADATDGWHRARMLRRLAP
ncbi:MAG: hypothetical protein LCH84_09940 [Gemmatimonadetes bacterium]|nr:hypothetical protein [Gemmatimonadota bacterium]